MTVDIKKRIAIEGVTPELDCGRHPIKRVTGQRVEVEADIFSDGHDMVDSRLLFRRPSEDRWSEAPMVYLVNDRWRGAFTVDTPGVYLYTVEGWIDHFKTWQSDLRKKYEAGQNLEVDFLMGAALVEEAAGRASGADSEKLREIASTLKSGGDRTSTYTTAESAELVTLMRKYPHHEFTTRYSKELPVVVERKKALFSTWYERFPRSASPEPGRHGTFKDCEALLPEISRLGFDVLYLPPIHPIGRTKRKGKNNNPSSTPDDVGSPWAIGSKEGGHKSIHPGLGTMEDFERLVSVAGDFGVEIALDLAFQCSPDHPWVKEHPEWFRWRPDGTVQFAENPPKKYEDIIPINFETRDREGLWQELKSVVEFWAEKGVRIFRVDNPHTKPFYFWEWVIGEIRARWPEVIFLSEAFTRPKVKCKLAKAGFSQSYTYFTWRNTKWEITNYLQELTTTEVSEYLRPNFWPNTPDILPEHLQFGGRPAFIARLVLAATLSSNYGIYGPPFELCVDQALGEREEYLDSEKYEIRHWDWDRPGNIKDVITRVNSVRKENPALQETSNVRFVETDNDFVIAYLKATGDLSNIIITVVNLDPYHPQSCWLDVPVEVLGLGHDQPYMVHDLLTDNKFIWQGSRNFIILNPGELPAHVLRVRKRLRREHDFDYFM